MTDWKAYVRRRLPGLMLSPVREAEILEELAELLEDTYDDALAAGRSHEEALALAAAQLPEGGALARWIEQAERPVIARAPAAWQADQVEERLLRTQRGRLMNSFLQDVRYAFRMMSKHPGYTALAVLALGLGIGANSAIFSMSYALLEKPVALPDTRGLYAVEEYRLDSQVFNGSSPAAMADWRTQSTAISEWAASQFYDTNLSGKDMPERVQGFRVTANFFEVLGARPMHGRTFLKGEDTPGRERVAILGYGLWERRFGADAAVVGTTVRLEGQPFEIVGVMPREFDFPVSAELWMPMALTPKESEDRGNRSLDVIARIKPGATRQQAAAEIETIGARVARDFPDTSRGWGTRVIDIREKIAGNLTGDYMRLLLGAVVFVLLIACANVANLQLARASGRYREVGLRIALGASRWRVVRLLLTESVLQSLAGLGLGLVFAYWSLELARSNFPPEVLKYVPGITIMSLDWPTFAYSFAMALIAGVVAGLMPAIQVSRPNLNDALREGGRGSSPGGRHMTRNILVVAEVAFALVLLVGAGLMVHGVGTLRSAHDATRPDSVLTFEVNLPDLKYSELPPRVRFYDSVLERLKSLPGVESVGLGRSVPYNDGSSSGAISLEGRPAAAGETQWAQFQYVNEDWFGLFNIPLKDGRTFTFRDGPEAPLVAVISERTARRYWPNASPIGKRVRFGNDASNNPWRTIVGVVGNVHYNWFDREPAPVLYAPYRQSARQIMQFALRASGNPMSLAAAVRAQVAAVDPDMPIFGVKTHSSVIHESVIGVTYVAVMLAVMGMIALVLASVGLYGVMAYAVTERRHEIGVRMALGAQTRDVLRLVLARGITLTAIGLVIGMVLSYALANLLASLVVGVSATDIVSFGGVAALLAFVAMAATYIPARRAAQVDPLIAVRCE